MLALKPRKELINLFGPHTLELMALDSKAQTGCSASPLPHFTPFLMLGSGRVNVFAQDVASQENTCFSGIHLSKSSSPFTLWIRSCVLSHIGGLFMQWHLISSSWAIKLIMVSCYFHLCTALFPHALYLGICILSELPTRFHLSFL